MNKRGKEVKTNKKLAKRNYLNQKGITLIVLAVTIVVLLILAGVSISAIFNDNDIIKKAQETQNLINKSRENDIENKKELSNWLDNRLEGTTGGDTTGGDTTDGNTTDGNTTDGNTTGGDTTGEDDTSILPSTVSTIPYYPDDTFTKKEGTDLTSGLVIQDSNGNEYVWIEVPKTATVYSTAGLEITTFTDDEYTAIETDLHTYTKRYKNGEKLNISGGYFTDTYYSDEITGLTSTQYTELKQKMLKSVYQNGGFWVGRYEAGITENGTASGTPTIAPLSKQGTVENPVYPYTWVTCSQAQTLASQLSTENYTSSLMFGVQWDLVLKHIEVKEVAKGTALETIQSALEDDSSDWGNYNDSSTILTGSDERYKKMNIYDLAGNVSEWTLEYNSFYTDWVCVNRGGSYSISSNSDGPACCRDGSSENSSSTDIGFRVSLYK